MHTLLCYKQYSACFIYYDPTKDYDNDGTRHVSNRLEYNALCPQHAVLELMWHFMSMHPTATKAEFCTDDEQLVSALNKIQGLSESFMDGIPQSMFTEVRSKCELDNEGEELTFQAQ